MIKRSLLALIICMMLVLTSACSGNNGKQASGSTNTPVTTPSETPGETSGPEESGPPLENELFNKDFIVPDSNTRPVAVMIDNQGEKVLPQGGIGQAQIVYEILVEYNITRYMALFWNTMPDMIGPVRSSRHYFLDYSMEYDAVYTHFGWSEYARKDISRLKIQNINGLVNGKAFWDITTVKGNWQDSFTSREKLEAEIARLKYSTEPKKPFPFQYNDQFVVPESGTKAESVSVKFASKGSTCGYTYEPESSSYARLRDGKPHMDRNSGEQVKVTNIIFLEMDAPLIKGDSAGRRNLNDIGSGDGWFVTGGRAIHIKWAKTARDAQTTYTTDDGKPVTLNRGQTWIEIVSNLDYVKM